jgi:hypothetical protein
VDPNVALEKLLGIASRIHDGEEGPHDAGEMADLIDELDHWLSRKGFLPDRWKR